MSRFPSELFESKEVADLVCKSLKKPEEGIAEILYHYYGDIYATSHSMWFHFKGHRWSYRSCGPLIREGKNKLLDLYNKLLQFYHDNNIDTRNVSKILKKLRSAPEREKIERYSSLIFYRTDFCDRLNANRNLLGFYNGVLPLVVSPREGVFDLQRNIFRSGQPTDMISRYCSYNFSEHHSRRYYDLVKFLCDALPDDQDLDGFLRYASQGLFGNPEKLLVILGGIGSNCKRTLMHLLVMTIGSYCRFVNYDDLVKSSFNKTRMVIVIKLEGKIDRRVVERVTGQSDDNFMTFIVCNGIPDVSELDQDLAEHIRIINFTTHIVDNPTGSQQYKSERVMLGSMETVRNDFMLLLLRYHNKEN